MYKTKEIQNYTKIIIKPMLYAITGFALVLMLPFSYVIAVPPDSRWAGTGECDAGSQTAELTGVVTCCWFEEPEGGAEGPEVKYCQACASEAGGGLNCNPKYVAMLTPPTAGETVLPGDGVLEQPENPTPRTPGQSILPGEGVLEQPETSDEKDDLRNPDIRSGVLEQPEEASSNEGNAGNVPLNGEVTRE